MKPTIELTIGLQRLEQLADHLENGKLGHAEFYFGDFNGNAEPYQCGTAGCALGECPILFPEAWHFDRFAYPVLKDTGLDEMPTVSASIFFGIDRREAYHLFMPLEQDTELGEMLSGDATKEQVAQNIRTFIMLKLKGA